MIFHLLTGKRPFGSGLPAVHKILEGQRESYPQKIMANPQFKPLIEDIQKIVDRCLDPDPDTRLSSDDLVRMCEYLCYPNNERYTGVVNAFKYNSWGFINHNGEDVFFHRDSVWGKIPSRGATVMFSVFPGGRANRAHPVVPLKN